MITRAAELSDIMYVLGRLSEQNASELKAAGLNSWASLKLFKGYNDAIPAQVALIDDKPACVFGLAPSEDMMTTWFIATKAYFEHGAPAVLHAKRYLRDKSAEHGPLTTVTMSTHPDTERWFEILGYKKVMEKDGARVFCYS